MLKKDVKIHSVYFAKISGAIAPVRIIDTHWNGGWIGVNTHTGREVRIKSAAKLRCEVKPKTDKEKAVSKKKAASPSSDAQTKAAPAKVAAKAEQTPAKPGKSAKTKGAGRSGKPASTDAGAGGLDEPASGRHILCDDQGAKDAAPPPTDSAPHATETFDDAIPSDDLDPPPDAADNTAAPRADGGMSLEAACADYVEHMKQKGQSPSTCGTIQRTMTLLTDELGPKTLVGAITVLQIEAFCNCTSATQQPGKDGLKPRAEASVLQIRRIVRMALVHWREQGLMAAAPVPGEKKRPAEKAEPKAEAKPKRGSKAKAKAEAEHAMAAGEQATP